MFIFSTIAMTLPIAFTCRSSGCFLSAGALCRPEQAWAVCLTALPFPDGTLECSNVSNNPILKTELTVEKFMCQAVRYPAIICLLQACQRVPQH